MLDYAQMVVKLLRLNDTLRDAVLKTAGTYEEALDALNAEPFDVAFFDFYLGARSGLMLLQDARQQGITTQVIVLTGRGAEEVAVDAMKAGAADYLSKANITPESLERTVRHALAIRAEEKQRHQAEAAASLPSLREAETRAAAALQRLVIARETLDREEARAAAEAEER